MIYKKNKLQVAFFTKLIFFNLIYRIYFYTIHSFLYDALAA